MACLKKCCPLSHAIILILSCASPIIVESARPGFSYKGSQHSPSYLGRHYFPNEQLYHAYLTIQRFKSTITCDPRNITSTWVGNDICSERSYIGFHCTKQGGGGDNLTVNSAIFNGFGLCAPKLQGFVDQLPDLSLFQATSNNFGGDIPDQFGDKTKMYSLDVVDGRSAQFSESKKKSPSYGIPSYSALALNGYGLKAKLPGSLDKTLTNLGGISITPEIPSSPSAENLVSPQMTYLALANNKLTGPFPPSIAKTQDTLLEVLLLNNQLSGCIPYEVGMLHKAAVIDAGMNQLTGPIPSSFSCLSSVEQLNLAGNRLYGDVPDALCKLAAGPAGRLANLTLSGNYFTSVGPVCAALIKDGVLDVKNNCIPGLANQRRPAECAAFHSQPKTCPAATTQVACPAVAATNAAVPAERKARDYSSYVTYATLHD